MIDYDFGEILLLKFQHSEGIKETKRPAVVLAQTYVEDIIVSKITSSDQRSNYDIIIDDWQKVGLLFPTAIRVDKLATLSKSRVVKKLGTLGKSYNSTIRMKIKQLFGIRQDVDIIQIRPR